MQMLRVSRIAVAIAAVFVLTSIGLTVAGQQRRDSTPTLKGVWRVVEIKYTGPNARTIASPQPWMVIFTDKHVASVGVSSDTARQQLPAPDQQTDKQLADAYRTFVGFVSTYEVSGDEFTRRPIVDLNPNNTRPGFFAAPTFRFEGNDTFYWTNVRTDAGRNATPSTWKFVRVE